MKFYVVTGAKDGAVVGCETSFAKARKLGIKEWGRNKFTVDEIFTGNARETIRRLLGQLGAYAAQQKRVYPKDSD